MLHHIGFINYNKSNYSFYPMSIGLIIICGFEWKRNNNDIYFYFFIFLSISESLILIVMQGNYLHEIFTSALILLLSDLSYGNGTRPARY